MKLDKCDLCEKTEMDEMLLKYPFVISYKKEITTEEHVDENAYLCLQCLKNDYKQQT